MHDYRDGILQAYDLAIKNHDDRYQVVGMCHYKTSAAPDNLFAVNEDCKKLANEAAAAFHTIVAKVLYVTKGDRPVTSMTIEFLTTRFRSPDIDSWEKLCHLMEYQEDDRDRPLMLGADN
jgi:hypothetical protein